MKKIPKGCDQQGRHPEAAECCTELGADQDGDTSPLDFGSLLVAVFAVGLVAVVANLLLAALQ
jgi:hypothetical protein